MLWLVSLCACLFSWSSPSPNYSQVRQLYQEALSDPSKIDNFESLTQLNGINNTTTLMAFHATALALKARESKLVSTKYSLAKKAYSLLNQSVSSNTSNCEIRFLRFSFECNVPSMLGMKEHIENDKQYLIRNLKSTEPLFPIMVAFFNQCSQLSETEKKMLIER